MNISTDLVAITGNTYPVKDSLKAIGARWNPDRKCWMISSDKAEQAKAIVTGAGPQLPKSYGRGSFAAKSAWAYANQGGVGFCGAPGCGRNGCPDCRD